MIYLEGTIEKFLRSSLRFREDNPVFQRSFTMDIELVNMFIKVVDFLKDYIKNKYNRLRMWLLRTWPLEKNTKNLNSSLSVFKYYLCDPRPVIEFA